jgi:hypothetical protein
VQNNVTTEIEKLVADMQQNMHTCIPGKIDSFDAEKCLAKVTPTGQFKQPNGKLLDYPQVHDVPVVLLQSAGQDCTIAYPIKAGDGCILFFSEQELDKFRDGEDAKCDLRFDLTNAICLVGLFQKANKVMKDACNSGAIIIQNKEKSCVTIKENEIIFDTNGTVIAIESGKVTISAKNVEIIGNLKVSQIINGNIVGDFANDLTAHTHAAPGSPAIPLGEFTPPETEEK